MDTISMNLSIPADLYNSLLLFVTKLTNLNSNDFIVEAIHQKLLNEKKQLTNSLIEGYKATKHEDLELTHEFETADFEKYDN